MQLKKIYKENGELDYLSLGHTGVGQAQNFSVKLVTELVSLGHIEINEKTLILHTHPVDLVYMIQRDPGRYCLHCGEKLPDDENGQLARLHVAMKHAKAKPVDGNPSGYEKINHFECVLDAKQHDEFRVKAPARAVHFPVKEK